MTARPSKLALFSPAQYDFLCHTRHVPTCHLICNILCHALSETTMPNKTHRSNVVELHEKGGFQDYSCLATYLAQTDSSTALLKPGAHCALRPAHQPGPPSSAHCWGSPRGNSSGEDSKTRAIRGANQTELADGLSWRVLLVSIWCWPVQSTFLALLYKQITYWNQSLKRKRKRKELEQ